MSQTAGLGKRAENRRQRRSEFMRLGAQAFLEKGLRDATMEDVAEKIGVSKVVLYRYFTSKDDMVDAILAQMVQRLIEVDRLPWTGYEDSIRQSVAVAWEDPAAFVLLARDARYDKAYAHHHFQAWQSIADRLTKAFLDLGVDEAHARMSGEAMTSYVINAEAYWLEHGRPEDDERFAEWAATGTRALDKAWRGAFGVDNKSAELSLELVK